MTDSPFPDDNQSDDDDAPLHGKVHHKNLSARLPEHVGAGVFSNGVLILSGPFEFICDFVLRMGENQRIVSRIVMPHAVARQFVSALTDNVGNYEKRFGPLPKMPQPQPLRDSTGEFRGSEEGIVSAQHETPPLPSEEEQKPAKPAAKQPAPPIEDIYDDLRLPDDLLSGRYANAVLIRHSGTEFCFDFITNLFPRSAVSARVFMASPHVGPFLSSMKRSLSGSESGGEPQQD
ncbi:MAG: DUF3467 domain-containing protein [Planctomycetaceae bacterium]